MNTHIHFSRLLRDTLARAVFHNKQALTMCDRVALVRRLRIQIRNTETAVSPDRAAPHAHTHTQDTHADICAHQSGSASAMAQRRLWRRRRRRRRHRIRRRSIKHSNAARSRGIYVATQRNTAFHSLERLESACARVPSSPHLRAPDWRLSSVRARARPRPVQTPRVRAVSFSVCVCRKSGLDKHSSCA